MDGTKFIEDGNNSQPSGECKSDTFEIFETMRFVRGHVYYLDLHLQRLERSADFFNFAFPRQNIMSEIMRMIPRETSRQRQFMRIALKNSGTNTVISVGARNGVKKNTRRGARNKNRRYSDVLLSDSLIDSSSVYFYHKTSCRELYNRSLQLAREKGYDEMLFFNKRGELCEGCISNVIIECKGQWLTPALTSGLLPGIMRGVLIRKGFLKEATLYRADLETADRIILCNTLRGLQEANIVS